MARCESSAAVGVQGSSAWTIEELWEIAHSQVARTARAVHQREMNTGGNQEDFFFFATFFSRTSTASRIRIRVIFDTVRSSCSASLSTRFRNSGSIRKVT